VKGQGEQSRAGDEGQTDAPNEVLEDRGQAEQYQPSKKMAQAEQKTIAENEGMGGPCHLYGGGAPPQQINTRACGQSSQKNDVKTKSSQPTSLVPRPKKTERMSVAQLREDDGQMNVAQLREDDGQSEVTTPGGPCHQYGGGAPHKQINTRACGIPSQLTTASLLTSLVPSSNRGVSVAQLKKSQNLELGGMSEQTMERRKSVGDIIKEIEGLQSADQVKAYGVADRLPSLKKDDGVADMLPALKGGGQDYKVTLSKNDEKIVRKMSAKLVHKRWELVKVCLNVIEENEEIVRRLTPKEKKKEMIVWNDDDERNVAKLRMRNVRFLNLKNGKKSGENKVNVLEQFCKKNGLAEQKESWRMTVENEIKMKETEVEELRKKKKEAKSKKRKLEIFKECSEKLKGMIVDWKETPGKDEEISYEMLREKILLERMENVENVVENVITDTDSFTLPLCLKTEEEEEKTISPKYSVSIAKDQVVQNATITVEGKYGISRKLQNVKPPKLVALRAKY
jgi:hypothetical protein